MEKSNTARKCARTVTATVIVLFLIGHGCAGPNAGTIRLSDRVNDLFESHRVPDNYNYYYSGPDARPNAILGVNEKYSLRSRLWKPVNLTPSQLGRWIDMMTDYRGYSIRTFGAEILGPNNEPIGIWYSPANWTSVELKENGEVVIDTPPAEPFTPKPGVIFGGSF